LREYAAARKEVLEQQLREIENEIRAQGIEPEKLDEEIKRLEAEARQALEEAEKLIPWELIKAGSRNRNGGK
jgi:SMC interacting uncharacterized protein involved in chromosome segregation